MALRHLTLKTRDLESTRRSYIGVLGLRAAFPHPGMAFPETAGVGDLLNFVRVKRRFNPRGRRARPLRSLAREAGMIFMWQGGPPEALGEGRRYQRRWRFRRFPAGAWVASHSRAPGVASQASPSSSTQITASSRLPTAYD